MKESQKKAIIYTDGCCKYGVVSRQSGPSAWAFVVINEEDKVIKKGSGYIEGKTHNYAELLAILEALKLIEKARVYEYFDIYSDSRYCIDGINRYMRNWKKNNFKTTASKELWMEIHKRVVLIESKLNFIWVAGHSGNKYNDMVDDMANKTVAEGMKESDTSNINILNVIDPNKFAITFAPYIDQQVTITVGEKEKTGKLFSINTKKNTIGMTYDNGSEFIFYLENGNVSLKK